MEIQSDNNVDMKQLSPSHQETNIDRAENEQPSKSEVQTTGEQVNSSPGTTTTSKLVQRPQWLPEGWIFECKIRKSGNRAGTVDKDLLPSVPSPAYAPGLKTNAQLLDMLKLILYLEKFPNLLYYEPVKGRQFRSKNEVLSFLETGKRRKRRPKTTSEGKDGDET